MTKTILDAVIVTIQTDTNGQLVGMPNVYPVTHDESVDFYVADPVRVEVSFDNSSCLTQTGPFYLDGSDPAKAGTGPIPVLSNARGPYPFTVAPETSPGSGIYKKRGDFEAKRGELDVTTEPEEEDKEKKEKKDKSR